MAGALTFDVRQDRREIEARLAALGVPGGASKVLQMTINRVLPSVRSAAGKALLKELGVRPKFTRASLKIRRSRLGRLDGALRADLKGIPLINFGALQTPQGVTYQIGSQPRELLGSAYINRGKSSGRQNVFRRVSADSRFADRGGAFGRRRSLSARQAADEPFARMTHAGSGLKLVGRYPTFIKYGPSPARVLALETAHQIMQTTARSRWPIELERALRQLLRVKGVAFDG